MKNLNEEVVVNLTEETVNFTEKIRVITRTISFLIPLGTLCVALFVIEPLRDIIGGALIGIATTAGVFYFKKSED